MGHSALGVEQKFPDILQFFVFQENNIISLKVHYATFLQELCLLFIGL